jgi:hypothetical protein
LQLIATVPNDQTGLQITSSFRGIVQSLWLREIWICLLFGHGIALDSAMAAKRFESAADHGDAIGANCFGLCLEFGKGDEADLPRASHYYLKAANSSNAEGQYHFGFCLERGIGVNANISEASRYYKMCSQMTHVDGLRSYARFEHYGLAGNEDLESAARLYELASGLLGVTFGDHRFRCLRSVNRAEIENIQYSAFSSVRLRVFFANANYRDV